MPFKPFKKKLTEDFPEILSRTSVSLLMKVAGLLFGYLFAFIVARFFGANVWGEFSLALSLITFGALLGTAGLDVGFLKIVSELKNKEKSREAYKSALTIVSFFSIIISILLFFTSGWIAVSLFYNPGLVYSFKLASVAVFPLSMINLNGGTLQGLNKIRKYVFLRFVSRHISALTLLLIFILFADLNHIVLITYILGIYMVMFLSFYWLKKEQILSFRLINSIKNKRSSYSRLIKLSVPLLFAGSLMFLNGWMDTIMVGVFMEEYEVGIYNITLKVSGLIVLVLGSVNIVIAPKISELYTSNKIEELKKVIRSSTSIIFYLTLPIFLILIILPEQILSIFGEGFTSGRYALIILSIGSMYSSFAGSVGNFMQMTNSQIAFQNITLICFILGFILNLILIPAFGINGAAWATSISMIFWNSTGILYIKYKYNINTFFRP